jgi:enamine deaminase RidA (YjgF/YER057c/UK114 family)
MEPVTRQYADLKNGSFGSLGYGHLPFRQAVRHGDVVYVTGQVAVEETPSSMPQQTRVAMANMKAVLTQVGATMADVVQTTSYYVGLEGLPESARIQSQELPNTVASTAVVVPALVEPRFLVEIEAIAVVGARKDAARLPGRDPVGVPGPACQAVRCGNTIYVSGLVATDGRGGVLHPGDMPRQAGATMDRMRSVLGELGATLDDVVHTNVYFVGAKGWKEAAEVRGRYFTIGPTSTGVVVPTLAEPGYLIQINAIAVVNTPKRYADAPTPNVVKKLGLEVPFRQGVKCGNTIYMSGQVALGEQGEALHPGDIASQTRVAMENIKELLAEFGASTEDVVRKNTYYVGVNDFRTTVPIRAEYFKTGICATGVGVDALVVPGLLIEIEVVAIA